ncbi:hypothetical protein BDV19DRAFT_64019 [Aspergillus venezuelensis]
MRCTDIAVILTTAFLFHGQGFLPSPERLLDPAEPGLSPRVARGNRHMYLDASDRHERSDSSQGSLGIFLRRKIPMDRVLEAQLKVGIFVCRPWRLISTPSMSMAWPIISLIKIATAQHGRISKPGVGTLYLGPFSRSP